VTLFGVASVCAELRVSAAPAIKIAAASVAAHITTFCGLGYEGAGSLTCCIVNLAFFPGPMAVQKMQVVVHKMQVENKN
jgi:hypothetical protein